VPSSADGCQRCDWQPRRRELWPTFGELGCDWIEEYCVLGEGDSYGKPFRLYEDQVRFVYNWCEFCPKCGQWHYSEAIWSAATGSGKTQFMAALAGLEFVGPREIRPRSANVVIAAAGYDQAGLLFGQTALIFGGRDEILKDAPLCGVCEVYENHITRHDGEPGQVTRVAAVAGTNEGGNPTLLLCDEVHEWGDVGDRKARLHMVIGKSTTKRSLKCVVDSEEVDRGRGRIVNLSTAGFDVDHSLLGKMYTRGKKAQHNPATSPRLLFYWREARKGLDYSRPEDREVACRDASGAAGIIWSVADRVAEWDNPEVEHHEWIRYYANAWVPVSQESWLKDHPGAYEACQGTWTIAGHEPTVLAIDMALKRDSVSVRELARLDDGRIATTARTWYPADGKIDHLEVFGYIRGRATELGERFNGLIYDPRFFELPARMLEEEGFLVIEFNQNPAQMAPACGITFDKIIRKEIVHDGDPDDVRQVNAAVKRQQETGGFTLSKPRSRIHIDNAITLCMGVDSLERLAPAVPWEDTVW
jgi:hypothetical protein